MSIATELQDLNDNILDAYTAVQGKGGTVPANKNMVNLPTAISSISGGGGVGVPREVNAQGKYQSPRGAFSFSIPPEATRLGEFSLQMAFRSYNSPRCAITSVTAPNIQSVEQRACEQMCQYCNGLLSVDFSAILNVTGDYAFSQAFYYCSSLSTINFGALTTVSGSNAFGEAFRYCSALSSVNFNSLTSITGVTAFASAFSSCTSLTSVSFPTLSTVSASRAFQYAFSSCTSLTSVSFPALTTTSFGSYTNQFNNMLSGVTGCTVHFPAAIQTTIGSWSDVTAGFGGTNTTVSFDL